MGRDSIRVGLRSCLDCGWREGHIFDWRFEKGGKGDGRSDFQKDTIERYMLRRSKDTLLSTMHNGSDAMRDSEAAESVAGTKVAAYLRASKMVDNDQPILNTHNTSNS